MTRRFLLVLIAGVGSHAAAGAADLVPPAGIVAPSYNWTGFYAGGQIGYGWGSNATHVSGIAPDPSVVEVNPFTVRANSRGVLGGFQIGHNWQSGSLIAGIEADLAYSGIRGTGTFSDFVSPLFGPITGQYQVVRQDLAWFGTLRGRIGMSPVDRLFIYATGGIAVGQIRTASEQIVSPSIHYNAYGSATRVGWSLGAGVEWVLTGNWTAKLEYLHYDLGRQKLAYLNPRPGLEGFGVLSVAETRGDIVRLGVNYRFN